jgi:hypothetical protein
MVMDLWESETKNNCAGEDQQEIAIPYWTRDYTVSNGATDE